MLYPQGVEFGDRNYPGACTRGVYSPEIHIERSSKHLKVFIYIYLLFTFLFSIFTFPPYAKKRTKVQLFFRIRKNVRIFDDFSTFYFCF